MSVPIRVCLIGMPGLVASVVAAALDSASQIVVQQSVDVDASGLGQTASHVDVVVAGTDSGAALLALLRPRTGLVVVDSDRLVICHSGPMWRLSRMYRQRA